MKATEKITFAEECYRLLRQVPVGKVTTYGEIAKAMNCRAYRAVGRAMNQNPYAPEVPCHRVVCSDGTLGGFAGGQPKKARLLEAEGVNVSGGKVTDFHRCLHAFGTRK